MSHWIDESTCVIRSLYVNLQAVLVSGTQTQISGLDASATAGVMTTRAAAEAFFVAGTNRAMFRFTLLNHMCTDLEQVKDPTRSPDRIRQDVSRSPGGDSRLFQNNCVGCHTGMDPMAQAFAYYNFNEASGNGAKSMGEEMAGSRAFASCRVKKAFRLACLRDPIDGADRRKSAI